LPYLPFICRLFQSVDPAGFTVWLLTYVKESRRVSLRHDQHIKAYKPRQKDIERHLAGFVAQEKLLQIRFLGRQKCRGAFLDRIAGMRNIAAR
jgi:hypothetical protein